MQAIRMIGISWNSGWISPDPRLCKFAHIACQDVAAEDAVCCLAKECMLLWQPHECMCSGLSNICKQSYLWTYKHLPLRLILANTNIKFFSDRVNISLLWTLMTLSWTCPILCRFFCNSRVGYVSKPAYLLMGRWRLCQGSVFPDHRNKPWSLLRVATSLCTNSSGVLIACNTTRYITNKARVAC